MREPIEPIADTISTPAPTTDPVPGELRAVLELFATDLRDVAFPGVDAAVLRRHADEVRGRARDVDRARAVLEAALAALDERTRALEAVAGRGLAYARIFAADQPALAERLASLGATPPAPAREAPAPTAPRRGRRPAVRPQLPLDGSSAADDAEVSSP